MWQITIRCPHSTPPRWLTSLPWLGWRIVATTATTQPQSKPTPTQSQSRRSFNYQAAGGSSNGGGNGDFLPANLWTAQEVGPRLTVQPFNYALKHGQRRPEAAAAAVKLRWKGRCKTATKRGYIGGGGVGAGKAGGKRWKPVAKAHGQSYLLRLLATLGNWGCRRRLQPLSEFKMRRSSGSYPHPSPKIVFSAFLFAQN